MVNSLAARMILFSVPGLCPQLLCLVSGCNSLIDHRSLVTFEKRAGLFLRLAKNPQLAFGFFSRNEVFSRAP
jgi:hypothetical protein